MRVALLLSLLLATGCTHYEYDLTRPPDLAQHIGSKEDVTATIDPLEYRFRSYEDHLVIQIYNPTDDPIQLVGEQSTVVDPKGQSHPLRSTTIESKSFVKLILPPPPPDVAPYYGPGIGVGFGMSAGSRRDDHPIYALTDGRHYHRGYRRQYIGGWGWNYWDPWWNYGYYSPRYYVVYNDTSYWNWAGETPVRLALTFRQNGSTFRDEFKFRRVKMK